MTRTRQSADATANSWTLNVRDSPSRAARMWGRTKVEVGKEAHTSVTVSPNLFA